MPFKKGQISNPHGRPVGSLNKRGSMGVRLQMILENQLEHLEDDLKAMEPAERVRCITALMQYVLPKYQAISMENQIELEYKAMGAMLSKSPQEALSVIAGTMLKLKTKESDNDTEIL